MGGLRGAPDGLGEERDVRLPGEEGRAELERQVHEDEEAPDHVGHLPEGALLGLEVLLLLLLRLKGTEARHGLATLHGASQ